MREKIRPMSSISSFRKKDRMKRVVGKNSRRGSIETRLALWILISVSVITAISLWYNYTSSKDLIIKEIEQNARETLKATVNRIDTILFSVEKATQGISTPMENPDFYVDHKENIFYLLREVVRKNWEIYGAAVAFEPFEFGKNLRFFAPYYYKSNGKIKFKFVPYNYFSWDWYMVPQLLQRPAWIEPYFGKAGGIVMTTYSVPFYKKIGEEKTFEGVACVDVSLAWLQKIVSAVRIGNTGFGFLLSKNGTFVTHPNSKYIMKESIFSVAKKLDSKELSQLGLRMIRGKSGFISFSGPFVKEPCWIAYAPLRANGWPLALIFPKKELLEDVKTLNRKILFISLLGFFFLMLVISLIAKGITRPLRSLAMVANRIAEGDWDAPLPAVRHEDEVGKLTHAFERMKTSLKQYFNDLKETTAAKERIESELRIARDIQMGLVPKIFPPFPDREEFDIYAILEPAREVGGDFYDFYFIDREHLCFVVGDVSGKGVPASLFMAVTKTLIKSDVHESIDPAAIITRVNQDLVQDNPSMMFVTIFLGILNVSTGRLVFCNGGHNPPYLVSPGAAPSQLPSTHGMALGVVEDFVYSSKELTLRPHENLVVYTDGVTEAMNTDDTLYGEHRLESILSKISAATAKETIEAVLTDVKAFTSGASQSDDITLLSIIFLGGPKTDTPENQ